MKPHSALPEVVSATVLLRGQPVLHIEHGGERYQLRLTKNGKLILTK
ncbi:MAG: hemin uptake protein HemP [Pseudomonadota bacterium]|nr:hemin uptake protein HemP [Pseudomonadota bacterium]